MQENFHVISHFFGGLFALLFFVLSILSKKGGRWHRLFGKIGVVLYVYLIVIGILAGLKYTFFSDVSLKGMLWTQAIFTSTLLVQGYWYAALKSSNSSLKKVIISLYLLTIIAGCFTMFVAIANKQLISLSLGLIIAIVAFKNIVTLGVSKNRIFIHSSALVTAGIFLTFNATGFYGLHDVYDLHGFVSITRALKSFLPLCVFIALADFALLWFNNNQKFISKND